MGIDYYSLGWLPECRSATVQQSVQGGSSKFLRLSATLTPSLTSVSPGLADADPILGEFFVKCALANVMHATSPTRLTFNCDRCISDSMPKLLH
jgi:hypothetical protein